MNITNTNKKENITNLTPTEHLVMGFKPEGFSLFLALSSVV